ncbi:hypothetical protein T265_15824, partial [Opisthorchis viverrini]
MLETAGHPILGDFVHTDFGTPKNGVKKVVGPHLLACSRASIRPHRFTFVLGFPGDALGLASVEM